MTRLFLRFGRQHGSSLRMAARSITKPSHLTMPFSVGMGSNSKKAYSQSTLPTIPTCPSPTCQCASTPEFPDGLEIDAETNLNGLMPAYAEHVLICTGKRDWPSKIEEENGGDNLASDLKGLFGRGGVYSDPFHNVSVINCSFPSTSGPSFPWEGPPETTSAYLLPSFKYVPWLPSSSGSFEATQALAKGFLLPEKLHPQHDGLTPPLHRDRLTRKEGYQALLPGVQDVRDVLVLICGHGGRDMRCGVIGPVLQEEFETQLAALGGHVATDAVKIPEGEQQQQHDPGDEALTLDASNASANDAGDKAKHVFTARVGLVSHIGGHKYAGNVILYVPPREKTADGVDHPLAGLGVWYGRVEPKHVEGIVRETILKGNVVKDHFRGAINQDRDIIKL